MSIIDEIKKTNTIEEKRVSLLDQVKYKLDFNIPGQISSLTIDDQPLRPMTAAEILMEKFGLTDNDVGNVWHWEAGKASDDEQTILKQYCNERGINLFYKDITQSSEFLELKRIQEKAYREYQVQQEAENLNKQPKDEGKPTSNISNDEAEIEGGTEENLGVPAKKGRAKKGASVDTDLKEGDQILG